MIITKTSYKDLLIISLDGILLDYYFHLLYKRFYHHGLLIIVMGALAGMLPDFLQFLLLVWEIKVAFVPLQRLHNWAHTKIKIDDKPVFRCIVSINHTIFSHMFLSFK